eukprot:11561221-Heterocapsa_arctica.AAC.1
MPQDDPKYELFQVLSQRLGVVLFEAMKDYDDYNTRMNFAGKYLKAVAADTPGGNPGWDPTGIHGSFCPFPAQGDPARDVNSGEP